MKPLHTISLLIPLALCPSLPMQAATAFDDDVPLEVVTQVLSAMMGGQTRLSADMPDGFPPFELPRDMSILAGVDQGYQQRVILKSRFDWQAANALAYGALLASGWQLVPMPGMQQPQTGFISPAQPVPQTQLCHDEYGMMSVSGQSGPGATYVNLSRNPSPPGMPVQPCNAQMQAMGGAPPEFVQQRMQQQQLLQQYLPRLELPNSGGMSAPMGGYGGGGGSPNDWEVRAVLSGDWRLRRVYEHFADQIARQGWKRDARVVGKTMASGSWTKSVDEVELIGSLVVLLTDDKNYDLRFRLLRVGAAPAAGMNTIFMRDGPALGIRGISVP